MAHRQRNLAALIIVETVFRIPGIGATVLEAVQQESWSSQDAIAGNTRQEPGVTSNGSMNLSAVWPMQSRPNSP